MTLPEAIKKMTSMPAARMKLKDRGVVRAGMKADLVVFDPATVIDRSTFEQPRLRAEGVHFVFVNGRPVWGADASDSSRRPGRVLDRSNSENP
jgi:N-acyl-D-aspartate/D-glutamate deacylase